MRFGAEINHLDKVDSTNVYLEELLKSGSVDEGALFIAREQTLGRGQENNSWESEPGKNLTLSFVVYPKFLAADQQFEFNKTISLAVKDLVQELIPAPVAIKWPNDIYSGDDKIAGMLFINSVQGNLIHSIITGIGININQVSFLSDAPNPVSLKIITGTTYDLEEVAIKLSECLDKRYEQLKNGLSESINKDYMNSLYRMNEWKPYLYLKKPITAKISGVSDYGKLELLTEGGDTIACDIKEIAFLPD